MFQAYGLIYQLLRQGVHVHWIAERQLDLPTDDNYIAPS
jgi:hypothetical protein